MSQTERQVTKANPFTTALVVGLGWGLVFGFLDGLPILLELPILPHLRVRLQALTYLMVWYGLVGAIFFGLLGLIIWGVLRLLRLRSGQVLRRGAGRRWLVAAYSGISMGLAIVVPRMQSMDVQLHKLDDPGHAAITLALIGLGSVTGLVVGLGVYGGGYWWQDGRGFLRPLRWKVVRTGVLAVFLVGVVFLSAVIIYRSYLRDLAVFHPKPSGQVATPGQPNIVLITIDALRADHLGAYGYDPEISPNIDALARRGVAFDQAIAQAPWTVPSVASFITSLHPSELGICRQDTAAVDMHVDKMRVTLAEALHGTGYRTQAYVTNSLITPGHWFNQGFDNFVPARPKRSFDLSALQERSLVRLVCRESVGPFARWVCNLFNQGHRQLFDPRLSGKGGRWITEYGRRFLRLHRDERFFLWLYYIEPHAPYDPSQPFRPLPVEITPGRERYLRQTMTGFRKETIRPVDLQALVSLYDGEIAYTDALVGQVMNELDRLGLTDRTVVILNADHGEEFSDHGGFTHGHTMYDELLRVPFIISGPGIETPGRRVETQARLLDLVPTVCEIAGAPIPEEAEGRSLVPFLKGEELEGMPAFSEALGTVFEKKAIRYNGYKLIYDVESRGMELYDLRSDPHEQVDLADQEPEIVETMSAELEVWMARSARLAAELPRLRPLSQTLDDEMRQRLRDAGY